MTGLKPFILILVGLLCMGCPEKPEFEGLSGFGKRPVYISVEELENIGNIEPQEVQQSGPIFLLNDWFFMLELGLGIHVFDIADENQEAAITFIQIPTITDFTIEDNILYCDSAADLVAIDITDIFAVEVLSRTEDVFDLPQIPPNHFGIFECVDETQGLVQNWVDDQLENVFCEIPF